MAFSDKNFKRLGDVIVAYSLIHQRISGLDKIQFATVSEYLTNEIQFVLDNADYKISEETICESLLYPILKEIWKAYVNEFTLWSHKSLVYDDTLKGVPDYIFSKRSKHGYIAFENPYIAVVEAKLDDFVGGWVQCALEMIAIQKINMQKEKPIYGIVTNGDFWEFGKLENDLFTQYKEKISISNLPQLMGVLDYILAECKRIYIDGEN